MQIAVLLILLGASSRQSVVSSLPVCAPVSTSAPLQPSQQCSPAAPVLGPGARPRRREGGHGTGQWGGRRPGGPIGGRGGGRGRAGQADNQSAEEAGIWFPAHVAALVAWLGGRQWQCLQGAGTGGSRGLRGREPWSSEGVTLIVKKGAWDSRGSEEVQKEAWDGQRGKQRVIL